MLTSEPAADGSAWAIITRFGESGALLPLMLVLIASLAWSTRPARPALAWTLPIGAALVLTGVSKIAFLGFAVGIEALDFTGFSGHATVAAAVYPVLAGMLTVRASGRLRALALALAYGIALLVTVSRYEVGAHSPSEAVAGFVLGAVASAMALRRVIDMPRGAGVAAAALIAMAVWALTPQAPRLFHSHDLITRLALRLSNRSSPFTREHLHSHRNPRPVHAAGPIMPPGQGWAVVARGDIIRSCL